MTLKHRTQVNFPDIERVKDPVLLQIFLDLLKTTNDVYKNIYDDLITLVPANSSTLPTASIEWLGRFYRRTNAGEDTLHFCVINTGTGVYSWKQVTLT